MMFLLLLMIFGCLQVFGSCPCPEAARTSTPPQAAFVRVPVVYHPSYNISFGGIERWLHAFDGQKYSRVQRHLTDTLCIAPDSMFVPGHPVTDEELRQIHTPGYLQSLTVSRSVARMLEIPLLAYIPNCVIQRLVLTPMRWAVAGTLLATDLALEHGWAVNVGGGYHHAKHDSGGGFCCFADISLAACSALRQHPERVRRVLIVDLDAHQGNGHEAIKLSGYDSTAVSIFDIYNQE